MKHYPMPGGGAMPALGLGTWKSDPGQVERVIAEALQIGYRHIDCAAIYGNEAEIGRALGSAMGAGRLQREDLWITSKLWNDMHEPHNVRRALERSLRDLRLDYLDLYLMHWPIALRQGVFVPENPGDFLSLDEVPLSETWAAMERCVDVGLCRAIGVSNFSVVKLKRILEGARIRPATNQVEMHPFLQQRELVAFCRDEAIVVTAYSPLGSPDRPPVLKREQEPRLLDHPVVCSIAERLDATAARVLIAWGLQRDAAVIPKSVNPERLRENLAAAELSLADQDMTALARLDRGFRYVHGEFWVVEDGPVTTADIWDE